MDQNLIGKDGGMPPEMLAQLQRLKIWEKLKQGALHAITRQNCEDLFFVLDKEDRGEIQKEDLFLLRQVPGLTLTENDIVALADDCDKNGNGKISVEELYKALTQGQLAFNMVKELLGKNEKHVDEKALELTKVVSFLAQEYEISSALWSLPQTFVLFVVFMMLMSKHLNLTIAFDMQSGLLNEIEGEGPPYLHKHEWAIVHDVPTMWQWMDSSFISLNFKNGDGELDFFPYPGRVASYNQIIGGIELVKTQVVEPIPCGTSSVLRNVYDSISGQCHRGDNIVTESEFLSYHLNLDSLHEKIQNLTREDWIDQNTTSLDAHTLFYNAHMNAFTDCHLTFNFLSTGLVKVVINMETFQADAYHAKEWIIFDVLFVFLLFRMLYAETSEIIPAIRNGLDGIKNYMEFWNLIDWLSIIVGAIVIGFWAEITAMVGGVLQDKISALPTPELDEMVLRNRTYLSFEDVRSVIADADLEQRISEVHAVALDISGKHETLRLLVFWYAFVLMMKFFKAFQANPRLDIVIRTLEKSAVDITHFLIVFFTIFFCFSSAGYVVFGKALKGFKDQYQSMLMCWRILMGEFDVDEMELVNYFYTSIWLVLFQFMVLLILLNMLLAIIMDTYVAAKLEAGENQVTIWTQIKEACYTARETQGHLPLYTVLLELQDEDCPCHPAPIVTSKSLRRAFNKKMTRHQADYILRKTADFIREGARSLDLGMVDTVRLLSMVKVNVQKNVEDTQMILEMIKDQQSAGQRARIDALISGEDPGNAQGGGANPGMPMASNAHAIPGIPGQVPHQNRMSQQQQHHQQPTAPGYSSSGAGVFGTESLATSFNAGMSMDQGQMGPMMAMMQQVQASMASMEAQHAKNATILQEQLEEQQRYIEQRDTWLEQRLNALERRCERVELRNDKLYMTLQEIDFKDIAALPGRVESMLKPLSKLGVGGPGKPHSGIPSGIPNFKSSSSNSAPNGTGSTSLAVPAAESSGDEPRSNERIRRLEAKLEEMSQQVEQLVAHAEENAEQRKLLWKIDLGIRQLRQSGNQVQQPPPQASAADRRQAARQAMKDNMRLGAPGRQDGALGSSEAMTPMATGDTQNPPSRLPPAPVSAGSQARGPDRAPSTPDGQPRPTDITADRGS